GGRLAPLPQHHPPPALHLALPPPLAPLRPPRPPQLRRRIAGRVEHLHPPPRELLRRQRELQRLVVRVEHHVEAVVAHPFAVLAGPLDRGAVQENAQRLGETLLPGLLRHLFRARGEPG